MFCSNCGAKLGAVAHIQNDQLLCEDCYEKLLNEQAPPPSTQHTIALSPENENDERKQAAQRIAPMQVPAQAVSSVAPNKTELTPAQENVVLAKFLLPGESILWKRSFSKGVINRHLTYTDIVTSLRAASVDDEKLSIMGYAPLAQSQVTVDREKREYGGVHSGVESHGVYVGTSSGQSVSYGDVSFLVNGKLALVFYNVRDPHGLKNLITASKKSVS